MKSLLKDTTVSRLLASFLSLPAGMNPYLLSCVLSLKWEREAGFKLDEGPSRIQTLETKKATGHLKGSLFVGLYSQGR